MIRRSLNQEYYGIKEPMDYRAQRRRLRHLVFGCYCQIAHRNGGHFRNQGCFHRPLKCLHFRLLMFGAFDTNRHIEATFAVEALPSKRFGGYRLLLMLNGLKRIATDAANGSFQSYMPIFLKAESSLEYWQA